MKFDHGKPSLIANLKVQNTSNQAFTLQSMAGNVYANNTLVGNVALFSSVTIPPNKQAIIPMNIDLLLIGLVNNIIDAITNGSVKQNLELEALANVDGFQVPVDLEYKIG